MEIRIYSNTGELRLAAAPSQSDRETAGIGQDSVLSLSLTAFECVALEVYDYVDFLGRRYILTDAYLPKMVARGEWKYDLKLYGVEALAAHTLMVNPTDGDDNPEVTLTAPAAEHAALIVANLNRRTGTTLWQVGTVIDTPYIDLDYTGMTASDAIAALASAAGSEWWFDGYTFNLCRCEYGDAIQLEYGGMLLSEITPGIADGATFFTRLFPLGSTRNIDPDKYGHARLQLPDGSRYVDSRTDLGIIEAFEEDAFAGIYPRRVGKVGEVRSEQRTGEDGVDYTVWYFTDPDLPFNPNDYEIGGLVKKVTFQSGELRGRVFEVNYDTAGKEFEIITQWPYENDVQLPTPPLIPATGDEYVLWNISMPESYYPAAEEEYRQAVDEFIADKQREVTQFSAPTDCTVVGSAAAELRPGRRVRIVSAEYFPETGYRETRIISVSRSVENPASMTLTMGDVLSSGRLQRIENGLSEISGATSRIETNLSSSSQSLQRKLDRSVFYDLFGKVNIGTTSAPKYAIRAKYSFYTDGFLSALGLNPNTGGGGGGGATALSELSDVQLSGLLTGDVLIYDGTHWVNRPQSSIVPNLSEYATRTWVQQQGYATSAALAAHAGNTTLHVTSSERTLWNKTAADFAAIVGPDSDDIINKWEEVVAFLDTYTEADTLANLLSNKVDKVAGYGLSKNDFTDALLSKLNGIEAGANRYVHPTGGADAAIDDAAGRVLAGITVNALGHVTSVSSKTLAAADIPTLSISKVSGLQDALDGKLDKAEFYKYFEEVNIGTEAAPVYATRSKRGLFSDSFLSSLGLNSSGGGGTGGASYDRLDLWSDYTSERAGWVLSAALGYDLHSRVSSLEGGSALSFTTEGTGNVVTAVKKSGTAVIVTKGLTALTSHQPIYSLNFQAGAFEAKKYTPNTGVATVNIPTKTSHLSNDSGFITAAALTGYATQSWVQGLGYITATTANATFATKLGVSGTQIGTYVNGKLGNLITVPYAANADTVDGYNALRFQRDVYSYYDTLGYADTTVNPTVLAYATGLSNFRFVDTKFYREATAISRRTQVAYPYDSLSNISYRYYRDGWSEWKTVANLDDNVASATKLQTARTLWGQTFDGSGNVSGDMTDVKSINANDFIRAKTAYYLYNSDDTYRLTATISGNSSIARLYMIRHTDSVYGDLYLGHSGGTAICIKDGTNVGIGNPNPAYKLDVAGAIRIQNRLYFGDSAHYIEVDGDGYFHFSHGVYTDGFLSAKGLNSSGGGGEGGASYDRLDAWSDYTSERAGWVLSAALGYDLHSRDRSLEGGSALSFTTEGTGNVVTAVKKSGTAVIVTKGLTALTSHQPIYSLNFQAGAFEAKKYTPNTGVATVNIPTKTSHLSNDSGFLTSAALSGYATQSWVQGLGYITSTTAEATFATKLGISGNQIGTYVGGKLGNLITVPYAANADKWDGEQLSSFRLRKKYAVDLTSLSSSNFYPVVFSSNYTELDCEIHSPSGLSSAAYNQNHIHYLLTAQGWSDTRKRFVILSQGNFSNDEITIGAVGYGLREGMTCVWLRGGRSYDFVSNRIPTLKTADYTYGDEVYTVGTALSGGANQNVTVVWQNDGSRTDSVVALQGGTIASALEAANADQLDGYHESSFFRDQRGMIQEADLDTFVSRASGTYSIVVNTFRDSMAVFKSPSSSASALELRFRYSGALWARFSADANRYTTDWKQIAFTDSNVASATKLQTARTLWGQTFDGTGNVSGDMTGVGVIRARTAFYLSNTDSTYRWTASINGNDTVARLYMYNDAESKYGDLYLGNTSGTAICIKGGTNVGIGNPNPAYKLDVAGISRFSSGLIVPYTGGVWINMATRTNLIRSETNNSASQAHALYRVKDSGGNAVVFGGLGGDVGFYGFSAANISAGTNLRSWWTTWNGSTGILTHNKDLEVLGTIHSATGIYSDGYMSAKGINTASDVRLKRRMEDVVLTVRDVAEAPVYRFAWINGGGVDVGSTAQYWAARVPELTHRLQDGIHLGLDYGKTAVVGLVPVAKATLANTQDIADHERRIASLERENAALKRQLQIQNAI